MCRVREFNLSYDSLTDVRTTRARLNNLKATDPEFYAELTGTTFEETNVPSQPNQTLAEDLEPDLDAALEDDSDLPFDVVHAVIAGRKPRVPVKFSSDGGIAADAAAESNDEPQVDKGKLAESSSTTVEVDGKRKRKENSRYSEVGLRWWTDV